MLTEEERDRRTVFCHQLAARLKNRELADFFADVGPVREAKIIQDRISRRSKGYAYIMLAIYANFASVAYVEFRDEKHVSLALEKTGQKLLGIPIIVEITEAEKNRQAMLKAELAAYVYPSSGDH